VRVTVTGTNDAPVIDQANSAISGGVTEGFETTFTQGRLVATDPDAGGTVAWTGGGNGLYGTFAILSDGSWTYLLDNVRAEVLSQGAVVTETFTATVTDNLGQSLTQEVWINITGTNDAPVISKTIIAEVTQNTAFSGAIVATDADSSGKLTFAAAAGSGPSNGALTLNADGTYNYTPNTNFQGLDSFGFTVRDTDGGVTSGSVTVEVESAPVMTPGGAVASVEISTLATATAPAGNLAIKASPPDATSVNLVFALDGSGSIGSTGWAQQAFSVATALQQLASQFSGSATSVDVQIVTFATDVQVTQTYNLLDPDLPGDVIALPYPGGFTRWDLAFDAAETFFDNQPSSETNFLLFITDGRPTGGAWVSALDSLRNGGSIGYGVTIEVYGIGTAIDLNTLSLVDATPTLLSAPSELSGALSGSAIFNPILIDFELTLTSDGVDHGVIANKASSGVVNTGLNYDLAMAEINGIETLLGMENRFSVTVRFDLDGNMNTAEIVLFSTERLSASTVAEVLTGLNDSDLLLGGEMGDLINGAGGNDVILGFGGDDTIDGGLGSDIMLAGDGDDILVLSNAPGADIDRLDGGAGTDTLLIDIGNAPGTDLMPSLQLSGIEAIDMANGLANSLELSLADILNMSDTGHVELNSLLGADLTGSMVILGEALIDTLTLAAGGTGQFRAATTAAVKDSDGNMLNIYEYVDGGNVLATLGIDDDVVVDMPVA
ncbi:VCBS domain-containing protein, partial [Sulfitobacter sp.]|uniref:VCBS domain-containing protein n=1 Tax=Sulfitobacter sp. TaxID=1903071 RepID=UPI00300357B9